MSTDVHDLGDQRRLTVTFTDTGGSDVDPTTVTFRIQEPDGTDTQYVYGADVQLVKSATGIYYVDFTPDQAGRHTYRFAGTGTCAQTAQSDFYVLRDDTQ